MWIKYCVGYAFTLNRYFRSDPIDFIETDSILFVWAKTDTYLPRRFYHIYVKLHWILLRCYNLYVITNMTSIVKIILAIEVGYTILSWYNYLNNGFTQSRSM